MHKIPRRLVGQPYFVMWQSGDDLAQFGQKVRADHAARLVPAAAWQTASAGHGSKGERDYGWAWLATASARHQLLIRRNLRDPAALAYFLCHVPVGCSFTTLVRVAGRRWPVEEDFALGKS